METVSRLALMALISRAGGPRGGGEKVTWNGSQGYLPIITVEDYDAEAGGDGKKRRRRRRLVRIPGEFDGRRGRRCSLGQALFSALLAVQCCAVVAVEAWVVYMAFEGGDFEVWNWLSEFASPGLLVLFSVSFSAMLLHAVRVQTGLADLAFQAAGLVLATFCAVIVCSGVSGVTEKGGFEEDLWWVVGVSVGMWFLFFIGFWSAVLRWYREDREDRVTRTQRKGKRRQRGYGTTSGGLAVQDETIEGFASDL